MTNLKYVKPELITLAHHPELNEQWVQARIAEDPTLLGLGDIILKDNERAQPHAGRLDLLCQDARANSPNPAPIIAVGLTETSVQTLESSGSRPLFPGGLHGCSCFRGFDQEALSRTEG